MGRPKIAIIDDSVPVEEVKKPQVKAVKKEKDSLIAQLNAELGIEEPVKENVILNDSEGSLANASKDADELRDSSATPQNDTKKKITKKEATSKSEAKQRSKKYLEATKELDRSLTYTIPEAIAQVKKNSITKFPGALEAHINTRYPNVRGLVSLPYVTGKKKVIMAFGDGASDSGADLVGNDETLEEIGKGKINFEILVVTPEWMPKLAKLAKVLGPKGLMPNPKNNTVTDNLKKTVESFQGGQTEYKTEPKAPVMHLTLGKLSQPDSELETNVKLLLSTIGKSRIKKVSLAPTMGPSVKVNLSSL